jgi:P4 family phage/plasmid primase-like protien
LSDLIVSPSGEESQPTDPDLFERVREALDKKAHPGGKGAPRAKAFETHGWRADNLEAVYPYHDADDQLLYFKIKYDRFVHDEMGKPRFEWGHFGGLGLQFNRAGYDGMLYRLPELQAGVKAGKVVWVAEGEKDVDRLRALGEVATTWSDGAWENKPGKKWNPLWAEEFRDATVSVVADRDLPGYVTAEYIAKALSRTAQQVKRYLPKPEHEHADVTDHFEAGHSLTAFEEVERFPKREGRVDNRASDYEDDEDEERAERIVPGYSEVDYAKKFAKRAGQQLRYSWTLQRWLKYGGQYWETDPGAEVHAEVLKFCQLMLSRVMLSRAGDEDEEKAARRYFTRAKLDSLQDLATRYAPIKDYDEWDNKPYLLGVRNGVVDLRDGTLREGQPDDRITRWVDLDYDPNAPTDRIQRFFLSVAWGDPDWVAYVLKAIGYSITGEMGEQVLFLCKGTKHGSNGKGVLFRLFQSTFERYTYALNFKDLADQEGGRFRSSAYALANLPGVRLVTSSETAEGSWFKTDRIKAMTGVDRLNERMIYERPVTFDLQAKFWLAVNTPPKAPKGDEAFFRRLRVIPFDVEFPVDREFEPWLQEQRQGFLRLAVEGAVAWYQHGLGEPPGRITHALKTYREGLDELNDYFDQRLDLSDPEAFIPMKKLRDDYAQYCDATGVPMVPRKSWGEALQDRGLWRKTKRYEGTPTMCWIGAKFKVPEGDEAPTEPGEQS